MNEKMITILTDETIKIWERFFFFLINEVNENHNTNGENSKSNSRSHSKSYVFTKCFHNNKKIANTYK